MKNVKEIIAEAEKKGKIRYYSEKNKHLFTKEEQTFFEIAEREPYKFYSSKYWKTQKEMVINQTQKAFISTPQPFIKQVLMDIIQPLPNFLPAHNMLEVTTYVVEEWERLTKEKKNILTNISEKEKIS